MDYRNFNSGVFEYMMKNALIERYRDEVRDLRKDSDEEFDFADALKMEMDKKNPPGNGNDKGNIW